MAVSFSQVGGRWLVTTVLSLLLMLAGCALFMVGDKHHGSRRTENMSNQQAPLRIELGQVETLIGSLQFTFFVSAEGDAHIQVYASDPSNAGKGGVMLMLDARGYEQLKAIIGGADATIDRMIREGRIRRMVLPY